MAQTTLGSLLDDARGRPAGFDYLRLTLSVLVLVTHAVGLTLGQEAMRDLFWSVPFVNALLLSILPMFFALSGFLVAGSLYRCRTMFKFLSLRTFRIYPALIVEVLLTAFLIGPFVTTLSATEYFFSEGFYRYLVNVSGHTTIFLPNTFIDNPRPEVANPQLWTVPYELICYIALALIVLIAGQHNRAILLLGTILCFGLALLHHSIASEGTFAAYDGAIAGRLLVVSFLCGVCFYIYREKTPVSGPLILASITISTLLLSFTFMGQYVAIITVSYLTCAIGVANPRRAVILQQADLSYGIFLYHGIIQQVIIHIFPQNASWDFVLFTSLPLSVGIAWLSWTFVEHPVMVRKGIIDKAEAKIFRKFA